MKFTAAATVLFSLAAVSAAQEIELDDVPRACSQSCQGIVDLATTCDQQNRDNDAGERSCICNGTNAQSLATDCAACAKANGQNDNDSDIADLMYDCGWNYASVSASTASATATTTTGATATATTITGTGTATGTGTSTATDAAATSATAAEGAAAPPLATAAVGGVVLAGLMMALPVVL